MLRAENKEKNRVGEIVSFLREIGIGVEFAPIEDETVLPGIDVDHGSLVIDESKLKYPGDLLHEAGHLAVVPAERRARMHKNVGQKANEEMLAIAWSYAAAVHIGIDASILFHADGYRGGGDSLAENFTNGRYFAVCALEWLGMTLEPKPNRQTPEAETYPKMRKWILDCPIETLTNTNENP